MAAKGSLAVGSEPWISAEKENIMQLVQDEKDEIIFPAQHEMEWLNEYMAEIFSQSHLDVANIFKTPGKLRGKTPRTARKRNVREQRVPLGDVFACAKPIQKQSPDRVQKQSRPVPRFAVSKENGNRKSQISRSLTDSGYHGSIQAETEVETETRVNSTTSISPGKCRVVDAELGELERARTTEGSFHSAKEDQTTKVLVSQDLRKQEEILVGLNAAIKSPLQSPQKPLEAPLNAHQEPYMNADFDDIGSPSDESTPDNRPLVRKSSLTFASLPAREPLKNSIGARISRTSHLDTVRAQNIGKANPISRPLPIPAQSMGDDNEDESIVVDEDDDDDENVEILGRDDSDDEIRYPSIKTHGKSTAQRLHEKIDMLGKAPAPRPSKSIPSAVSLSNLRQSEAQNTNSGPMEDDEDWIKPLNAAYTAAGQQTDGPAHDVDRNRSEDEDEFDVRAPELIAHEERMKTPIRMSPSPGKPIQGYERMKAASTATLASPAKLAASAAPAKAVSVSNPGLPSTTPQTSPKRLLDGPLSASKSKLHSIMKTAKGLFTSSASISAAAKMETLSPQALRMVANAMPGMYPNLNSILEHKPLPVEPPSRHLRNSTERERDEKRKEKDQQVMQKMNDQLDKARERERQKVAQATHNRIASTAPASPEKMVGPGKDHDNSDMPPPASHAISGKPVRPMKPTRENSTRAKPAPVSIRVGTLSQRVPVASSTTSTIPLSQEGHSSEVGRPGLTKKGSTASLHSATSTSTFKTSVSAQSIKPRALIAAERKKEQDEREQQRKMEQKRELERKRTQQQEEARQQEQKLRLEAEKKEKERITIEQAKRQAQQQAIERKRQEAARKAEQQRAERAQNDAPPHRPASRLAGASVHRLATQQLPTNPAKPAKRPLEEETSRPQASKFGVAPQAESKRRKTEDESTLEAPVRPTISGAPVRQSNLGKKTSIFAHSAYSTVPPAQAHVSQFPQPPNRPAPSMAQFGNGNRIPFAESQTQPQPATKTPTTQAKPLFSAYQQTISTVKSSPHQTQPHYMHGDAIHLPEIPTDSEDEDSDEETNNAFPLPDWATPGHLQAQLMRQEGMDGDAVFGPIAPLKMEEIFAKGNKDRLKRLRDRTSSANWVMSGDGLTLEEVRADREQRERMRLEGGWRFHAS